MTRPHLFGETADTAVVAYPPDESHVIIDVQHDVTDRIGLAEMVKVRFEERGTAEWDRMWRVLGMLPVNHTVEGDKTAAPCPHTGEVWQYMGTEASGGPAIVVGGEVPKDAVGIAGPVHVFRHRSHPAREGQRVIVRIAAKEAR